MSRHCIDVKDVICIRLSIHDAISRHSENVFDAEALFVNGNAIQMSMSGMCVPVLSIQWTTLVDTCTIGHIFCAEHLCRALTVNNFVLSICGEHEQ